MPLGGGQRFGRGFESMGLGSGVIIDKDNGYVVTNYHVVKDADQIVVRLSQGSDIPARVVGVDPKTDLAVLQINAELKVAAAWGDSDKLDIGDWVLAIGSPFALDHTVTAGIVSATERERPADQRVRVVHPDRRRDQPGQFGRPADRPERQGRRHQHGRSSPRPVATRGSAWPSPRRMARRVVESLIKDGKVVRGYLGVRIQSLTPALAKEFHLPDAAGRSVTGVQPGSPAERAGLQVGDVIVKLGDNEVADPPA